MRISIVTPTFNSAATILDTCRSVTAQDYPDFEHIIVDNLSKDETVPLIRDHYKAGTKGKHLKIISESDRGIPEAFNKGISASSGEVIAILNGDDSYFSPQVFKTVSDIFSTHAEVVIVHGKMLFEDNRHGTNIRSPLLCNIRAALPFNHPTMFIRRSLYEKHGLFDPSYHYAMDFEWLCRFYEKTEPSQLFYLEDFPITIMKAGGATDRQEVKALLETRRALRQHRLYDNRAKFFFGTRLLRIQVKYLLTSIKLNCLIRLWRALKWRN